MDIAIVLFDGFDDLDAIGPFEVFNHAREAGADLDVGLYSHTKQSIVTSSHGLRVEPDAELASWRETLRPILKSQPDAGADVQAPLLVVPGGGWSSGAEASVRAEVERGTLPEAIAGVYEEGARVASVCTGAMLLAEAGLTDGRPAVTHQSALQDLRETGATVVDERVVDDGDVLTAGGITAGIDLALHVVRSNFGTAVADQVAEVMEYEPRGEVYSPS